MCMCVQYISCDTSIDNQPPEVLCVGQLGTPFRVTAFSLSVTAQTPSHRLLLLLHFYLNIILAMNNSTSIYFTDKEIENEMCAAHCAMQCIMDSCVRHCLYAKNHTMDTHNVIEQPTRCRRQWRQRWQPINKIISQEMASHFISILFITIIVIIRKCLKCHSSWLEGKPHSVCMCACNFHDKYIFICTMVSDGLSAKCLYSVNQMMSENNW